ncbi:unnamed protein product [Owenia fusiformis]|uniref:Uncharacterized protein n=1 Tax=Owenia fusiformis TaxID=6347 RepID=A0A8S4PKL5_OWEFU|nr:unnamed protein product [Owenia fusiformis]
MRIIVVLAALVITGVSGQTCENKCNVRWQKCLDDCPPTTTETRCKLKDVGETCTKNYECEGLCVKGKCKRPPKCGGSCKFSIECKHECWCNQGMCERMVDIGGCCKKNDECKGLSKCVPLGNGTCEETCRVDNDCLQYDDGKNKYCTVGGTAGTQKGKCEMKHEKGYRCARSPECQGKMYCRNGQCQLAEEVVICSLNCHGPDPRKPDHIRPGFYVTVNYTCIFIRRAEMGHLKLKAEVRLDIVKEILRVSGMSPQYFNATVTKRARKGEFTASLHAVMKTCVSDKPKCQANRKCILHAGQ